MLSGYWFHRIIGNYLQWIQWSIEDVGSLQITFESFMNQIVFNQRYSSSGGLKQRAYKNDHLLFIVCYLSF